jgi:hypothetical protein
VRRTETPDWGADGILVLPTWRLLAFDTSFDGLACVVSLARDLSEFCRGDERLRAQPRGGPVPPAAYPQAWSRHLGRCNPAFGHRDGAVIGLDQRLSTDQEEWNRVDWCREVSRNYSMRSVSNQS